MIKVLLILEEKKLSKDKDNVIPFPGTKLPTKDTIDKLNDELLMQKEEVVEPQPHLMLPSLWGNRIPPNWKLL